MNRRTFLGAVGGGAALLGGGVVAAELFAPERATAVEDDRTNASTRSGAATPASTATVLQSGRFEGKAGHRCSGTVELAEDAAGLFLQFRDYDQTQGPDVYCYLTPAADPDTRSEVDAGTRVRIDGGADGGELTKTGTFAQALPDGVDPETVNGVAVWCDRFSTPFGAATLS
jgi:hypothetical protein